MAESQLDSQIYKLDYCYDVSVEMFKNVTESGEELLSRIKSIIGKLSVHWKASDAVIHINHLVDGYNKFSQFYESMFKVATDTVNYMVNSQELRAATKGSKNIGKRMSASYHHVGMQYLEDSSKYYYDPEVVKDSTELTNLISYFEDTIHKFKNLADELMLRWKYGVGHEETENHIEEFVTISIELKKYLSDTATELKTMIENVANNISQE